MSILTPWYTPFWYIETSPAITREDAVNEAMAKGAENAWPCADRNLEPDGSRSRLNKAIRPGYDVGTSTGDDIVIQCDEATAERIVNEVDG